jgi:hypothetical protein
MREPGGQVCHVRSVRPPGAVPLYFRAAVQAGPLLFAYEPRRGLRGPSLRRAP